MDPLLLTHRITDALFDIGPGFTPPSLRDQTIRAWLLTTKAAKHGIIGPAKPLLVVGAGLAGAVTALTAASLGVPTKVIDKSEKPLNVQLNCYSRVICPAQYDWPAGHWANGGLPWSGGIPLLWREAVAGYVASALGEDFVDAVVGSPLLEFFPYTEVPKDESEALKDYHPQGDFAINFSDVRNGTLDPNGPYRFAAVISCLGPGIERSSLDTYSGFRFWEMDPFSYSDLNLGKVIPKVYISGGGDGALQDFLRIATRLETAKKVFVALPEGARNLIERAMLTKEDNFKRGHSWFASDDHDMYQHIQDYCADVIDEVLDTYWKELNKTLEPMLAHLNEWTLRLVYRCKHFTNYYCLNRVLTLLVAHYWERKTGKGLLLPEFETNAVEGISHKCANKPWDCHGQDHTVLSHTSLCNHAFNVKHEEGRYNVVILRHGPEPPKTSFFGLPIEVRRQLLPYYL